MELVLKGTAVKIILASVVENEHEYQELLQLPERAEGAFLAVESPAVVVDVTYQKGSDKLAYVVAQSNNLYVVEQEAFEVAPTATIEEYKNFFFERFQSEVPNFKMIYVHETGMNPPNVL
ncbi:hypothetical protein vBVpP1_64 [Vibrio phage vB_VpP_1]|nr:hypothetical protein vBVpP1_64 [Vibrio phage vB_VpP_1]